MQLQKRKKRRHKTLQCVHEAIYLGEAARCYRKMKMRTASLMRKKLKKKPQYADTQEIF